MPVSIRNLTKKPLQQELHKFQVTYKMPTAAKLNNVPNEY